MAHGVVRLQLCVLPKYEALLFRRDAFFVLNFGLYVGDGIPDQDVERDALLRADLHKNFHGCRWAAQSKITGREPTRC